jgi:hypothetical protein
MTAFELAEMLRLVPADTPVFWHEDWGLVGRVGFTDGAAILYGSSRWCSRDAGAAREESDVPVVIRGGN